MKTPPLPAEALMTVTGLPYPLKGKGKVREVFDLGTHYLIVATDRLSAFDVVMPNGVPGKGILLTQISLWWFDQARLVFPTHLVPDHANALAKALHGHEHLIPRSMLVRKLQPLPVEAVVRGYLAGGGFKEYQKTGAILDHPLPAGLLDGSKLPQPIFTPSTKAAEGHDEAITRARCGEILGEKVFRTIQETSLALDHETAPDPVAQLGPRRRDALVGGDVVFLRVGMLGEKGGEFLDRVLPADVAPAVVKERLQAGQDQGCPP